MYYCIDHFFKFVGCREIAVLELLSLVDLSIIHRRDIVGDTLNVFPGVGVNLLSFISVVDYSTVFSVMESFIIHYILCLEASGLGFGFGANIDSSSRCGYKSYNKVRSHLLLI